MNIFNKIKNNWQQKQLTKAEFAYLFDPPKANEWVAIDCEMTGLNAKKNHILSVACVHINGNQIDSGNGLNLICRPPVMPTADTIVIHGLRPNDVEHGMNYQQMLDLLLPFIANRPIVGFCPQIDMAFLNPLVKQYIGVNLPNEVIDIRNLYERKTGNRTQGIQHQGQSLNKIVEKFNIPQLGEHDAYNDALMTAMAFAHLR